jgi:phosphatidyl-myo-inositol alpha-mannosyltransferase
MRIVQISPFSWDAPGGVQVHVRQLALHLGSRGHEVLILAPGEAPQRRSDVRIVGRAVPFRANGSVAPICLSPWSSRVVRQALREFHPDVIHVHEPLNPSTAMHGVLQANAPVVATFHSYVPRGNLQSKAYRAMMRMMRPVWERIDRRIAVSEAARYSVCSRMGDGGVRVLPNGANVQVFANAQPASLPPGRRLLFVGRLERRKGFPVAVRAFGRLATEYPDLRLVVVGDGADRDAIDDLPDAARARVDMLGRVSEQALPTFYRASNIFLAPSIGKESFGIVLIEAMASGLPVVASDIPGYREVLRRGREGLMVTPGESDELAEAVRHLLEYPALALALGRHGLLRARHFDWETIVDQLEEIYEELTRMPMRDHAASRVLAGV